MFNVVGLLNEICRRIQLSKPQHDAATKSYLAVGEWLIGDVVSKSVSESVIFPQGSMLLGTTAKPLSQAEYDLDQISKTTLNPYEVDAREHYAAVARRLRENRRYNDQLDPQPRCLRLSYQGQFHLDVVPACADPNRPGALLIVANATEKAWCKPIESWKPSHPLGYAAWFESKCRPSLLEKAAAIAPAPSYEDVTEKPALNPDNSRRP